jgi:hypothetical protein
MQCQSRKKWSSARNGYHSAVNAPTGLNSPTWLFCKLLYFFFFFFFFWQLNSFDKRTPIRIFEASDQSAVTLKAKSQTNRLSSKYFHSHSAKWRYIWIIDFWFRISSHITIDLLSVLGNSQPSQISKIFHEMLVGKWDGRFLSTMLCVSRFKGLLQT